MQIRPLAALQAKFRSTNQPEWPSAQPANHFFDIHPVGAILRSLFLSSLLWIFLAFTLYTVYSFVVAAN